MNQSPKLNELYENYLSVQDDLFSQVQKYKMFGKNKPINSAFKKRLDDLRKLWEYAKNTYENYQLKYETVYDDFIKNHDINVLLAKTNGSASSVKTLNDEFIIFSRKINGKVVYAKIIENYPYPPTIEPTHIEIPFEEWNKYKDKVETLVDQFPDPPIIKPTHIEIPFEVWKENKDNFDKLIPFNPFVATRRLLLLPRPVAAAAGGRRTKKRKGNKRRSRRRY